MDTLQQHSPDLARTIAVDSLLGMKSPAYCRELQKQEMSHGLGPCDGRGPDGTAIKQQIGHGYGHMESVLM